MKKKYKFGLSIVGIFIISLLALGTAYGVYNAFNSKDQKDWAKLDCFKVYYSKAETIEMTNIKAALDSDSIDTTPYTITITNICEEEKELQVRLNILKENTINTNALVISASGHIEKENTFYNGLDNTKTIDENVTQSKLIGKLNIKPNETIRTNIKMWFNEKKAPNLDGTEIFKAKFEIIDTDSSIKPTFAETILETNKNSIFKDNANFGDVAVTYNGLYLINSNTGNTYYYRGLNNNNYVLFGDKIWRIVAINDDNTIKLILDKSATYTHYGNNTNAMDYSGLKYLYNADTIDNNITAYLNNWYIENILNKGLDGYIVSKPFCNDSSYIRNYTHTYFGGYNRLVTSKTPSIVCPTSTSDFGGIYNLKVGLLTADEVVIAGGSFGMNNYSYYLYNGENFYTMTPSEYFNYTAQVFAVNTGGMLTTSPVNQTLGIRPVINLQANLTVSGAGTIDSPYVID